MAKNPFNQRNPRLIKDLSAYNALYICRDTFTNVMSALQIKLFMQNKAKFRKSQMNVNKVLTRDYVNRTLGERGKKQSQTNPNKAKFKKARMNVNRVLTKDYENKTPIRAPKKQSQTSKRQKTMQPSLSTWVIKKTAFSGSDKTNPIKPNFKRKNMLLRLTINPWRVSLCHYADRRLFAGQIPSRRHDFLPANYKLKLDFSLNYV